MKKLVIQQFLRKKRLLNQKILMLQVMVNNNTTIENHVELASITNQCLLGVGISRRLQSFLTSLFKTWDSKISRKFGIMLRVCLMVIVKSNVQEMKERVITKVPHRKITRYIWVNHPVEWHSDRLIIHQSTTVVDSNVSQYNL